MPALTPASSRQPARWIREPGTLEPVAARLKRAREIALDTESNSLHHFPERVCLIQIGEEDGAIWLVDPLLIADLGALGACCASGGVVKVLHGASYDVSSLKRDFAFTFARIFDTMIAAQFLGLPELGLSSLLERYFGVVPGRSRQKDDWTARPLTPEQEAYAAEDVRYLLPLRHRLAEELTTAGRLAWVEEECEALAALTPTERTFDADDAFRVKGASALDRRGLAALRELFVARESWAHATGRPPFRVLGNETLIRLAAERPGSREAILKIPGCTARWVGRHGEAALEAIARAQALPEEALPSPARPKRPRVPPAVERRLAALAAWRTAAAPRVGVDPGVLLPRRLMERLAEAPPPAVEGLGAIPGFRRWRIEHFGNDIVSALKDP